MKKMITMVAVMMLIAISVQAQFSISSGGVDYTQDFNGLANTGTGLAWSNGVTLTGWYAKTDATASISTYGTNTGSTTSAGLYSFGAASDPERSLGFAPSNAFTGGSGTGKGYIGWRLVNNTGMVITSISVTWTGEQWRSGNTVNQSVNLSYQTGSTVTDLTTGTWTSTGSSYTATNITNVGAIDGSTNQTSGINVLINTTIAAGAEIMLRWEDLNDSGNDHLIAIDDITINASTSSDGPPSVTNIQRSESIPTPSNNLQITADVTDDHTLSSVELEYQINGEGFTSIPMANEVGDNYSATLSSGTLIDGDYLEYRIKATDDADQSTTSSTFSQFVGVTPIGNLRDNDVNGLSIYAGQTVKISGIASINSGVVSATNLDVFIEDGTGGINVFKSGSGAFTITQGNQYTVTGQLLMFSGKLEIVPNDPNTDIVDEGASTLPSPYETVINSTSKLLGNAESLEGKLISLKNVTVQSGTWPASSSFVNISITDDGGTSLVDLRINNITSGSQPVGSFDLFGVLTQFDSSSPYTTGYQIYTRSASDFYAANSLPVELTSFTISASGKGVNLAWSTATESNNLGWDVERSTNGASWTKIGFVAGKGTTSEAQNYSFTDSKVSGRAEYRLKQTDTDGKSEYSRILTFEVLPSAFSVSNNYPNPFNPTTNFRFDLPKSSNVKIVVSNILGQQVAVVADREFSAGTNIEVPFNAGTLASGLYYYTITVGNKSVTKTMMLMK